MSEVRVNKISPRSGTTVTLGDNGDTISIPSGVILDASSGGLAGTLTTAAQPNITSVGTLTSFTSTGIDDNATSTAITINSSEFIGVGTASPQRLLHLQGNDGASGTTSGNSDTQLFIDNAGTNGAIIELGSATVGKGTIQFSDADASNRGSIGYAHTTDHMNFNTASSERMRIDSSGAMLLGTTTVGSASAGDLVVNGGVFLGGTAAANELDDYEEGTWTPVALFANDTSSNQAGTYTKIGNVVTACFTITFSATSYGVPQGFSGLPFTSANVTGNNAGVSIGLYTGAAAPSNTLTGNLLKNSTQIALNDANGTVVSDTRIRSANFNGVVVYRTA